MHAIVLLDLTSNSAWLNGLIFTVFAAGVWLCGAKLSGYVDLIADRTGLGKAFAGALLLGGATSLPELATTVTAGASGAAELAGSNLLGGVALQLVLLAVVDAAVVRGRALTFFSPAVELLMHGLLLVFLLTLTSAALATGELAVVGGVGVWPLLLATTYVLGLRLLYRYEGDPRWEPAGEIAQPPESARDLKDLYEDRYRGTSTSNIAGRFAVAAIGVLASGFMVARSGEVLAEQTGIGQGIAGAVLVALATTLPEVSTTWAAVRFGAYSMAVANILGTNSIEVALFLPADIAYTEGSIIEAMQPSASLLTAIGIMLTSVYIWGILERRDRTIFSMGRDSFAAVAIYVGGLALFSGM